MRTALQLITDAAKEPISLDDAKAHLRVDCEDDDELIKVMIKSVRRSIEKYLDRALITQDWAYWLDGIPMDYCGGPWWDGVREAPISIDSRALNFIEIPKAGLQSITSITSYDLDNAGTVFDSANYFVDTASIYGRIVLNYGAIWPNNLRSANAIKVLFRAGYGDSPTSVPEDIITAMKMLIAHYYENREAVNLEATVAVEVNMGVKWALAPYRVMKL